MLYKRHHTSTIITYFFFTPSLAISLVLLLHIVVYLQEKNRLQSCQPQLQRSCYSAMHNKDYNHLLKAQVPLFTYATRHRKSQQCFIQPLLTLHTLYHSFSVSPALPTHSTGSRLILISSAIPMADTFNT
jgi:hypothetical protein